MQALFRQVAIYSAVGQLYEPEDKDELLYYKESQEGQILEEGITEAGAIASWMAAATSYSNHGLSMLPFYIFTPCLGSNGSVIWCGQPVIPLPWVLDRCHRRAYHVVG